MNELDRRLIAEIQCGLPLVSRPYARIGARLGLSEDEVLARIRALQENGAIKRFGVIVRHHELGYHANAMVVWDVADADVHAIGAQMSALDYVTLCYRRPRQLPDWPYNLFCMIHGQDRDSVLANIAELIARCHLENIPYQVLFSRRRFKQCGARYAPSTDAGPLQRMGT